MAGSKEEVVRGNQTNRGEHLGKIRPVGESNYGIQLAVKDDQAGRSPRLEKVQVRLRYTSTHHAQTLCTGPLIIYIYHCSLVHVE